MSPEKKGKVRSDVVTKADHQTRVIYIDALRVLAIFAVIVLHTSASMWYSVPLDSFSWKMFNIYDSCVRWAVPVFVMVSGAFLLDPMRDYPFEKLKRKIFRIIKVFIIWSAIYALLGTFMKALIKKDAGIFFLSARFVYYFTLGHYHLWFCYMIIGLYLITPFLRRFTDNQRLMEYFICLSFLFCFCGNFLRNFPVPFVAKYFEILFSKVSLDFVAGYTGYFILGYYLKSCKIKHICKKVLYALGFFSLLFTIKGTEMLSLYKGVATEAFYGNLMPNVFFMSVAVFLMVKENFSGAGWDNYKYRVLIKLSDYSFGIYLVHDIFNHILNRAASPINTVSYSPLISVPCNSILVFVLSYFLVLGIKKLTFLGKRMF